MKSPLQIFLADLTYDTIAVSTEAMPINIGYIASYCIKKFGEQVQITLFKYISELEDAIEKNPPDVLGLSNYCWSQNVSYEMFRLCKEKNSNALLVWGGPNFPIDIKSQKEFLDKASIVDIYIPTEGEVGFANIIERTLEANLVDGKEKIISKPIEGCIVRNHEGKIDYVIPDVRIKTLDEIPSPYTTGLMDPFFDGKLVPMLQTNRGCPFTCTFCTDGRDEVMKVNKFSNQRVRDDIYYIAQHVPKNVHSMFISDLNFGMLPGDLETCDHIADAQNEYNYPQRIIATTGKNNKEGVVEAIRRLSGSISFSMSVQSMDQNVLKNIKRDNISVDKMISLAPAIKESGLYTIAEIILGLPGESTKDHLESIHKLVSAGLEDIVIHTCMLLPGSEMATPTEREKYKFQTKFRILPRDFATLKNGKRVCEIEEVVVGSKDMSFNDYVELRLMGFILWMTNKGVLYDPVLKFLKQNKIDTFELFYQMFLDKEKSHPSVRKMFEKYKSATIGELYSSPEEILEMIQDDEKYSELVEGKGAINVIQFHHAEVLSECMDEWTEFVIQTAEKILKEKNILNDNTKNQFKSICNYCKGLCHNPLGRDRLDTNP